MKDVKKIIEKKISEISNEESTILVLKGIDIKLLYNDLNINVTASFGVVELSDEINEMNALIAAADKNLYKAKELGKNMIIK